MPVNNSAVTPVCTLCLPNGLPYTIVPTEAATKGISCAKHAHQLLGAKHHECLSVNVCLSVTVDVFACLSVS